MIRYVRNKNKPRPEPDPAEGGVAEGKPPRPDRPRRKGRWRRRILYTLLLLVMVFAGMFALTRRPPAAWREYQHLITQTTRQERQRTVSKVMDGLEKELPPVPEQFTVQEIAGVKIDQTLTLTLDNQELSALTLEWFDTWTRQRGFVPPPEMRPPIIVALDGKLKMAFAVRHDDWSQVFGGEVRLMFQEDGLAIGSVHGFQVGSLPVPLHQVGQVLGDDLDYETARKIGAWVRKLEHFEFRPVLELEHRRRARVIRMQIHDDNTITLALRVQDHETYKRHNAQMALGRVGPNGKLAPGDPAPSLPVPSGVAGVPTATD
ncbi:MAG: hypothetical protein AAGC44_08445 [Planctomycetota bacterium]